MMVLGDSNFTGDTPKSSSSGMSSKALHPVARMGTMKRSRLGEDKRSGARRLKGDTFPRQEALSQRRGRRSSPQPLGLEQAPRRPSLILQMRLLIRGKAYLTHIMRNHASILSDDIRTPWVQARHCVRNLHPWCDLAR